MWCSAGSPLSTVCRCVTLRPTMLAVLGSVTTRLTVSASGPITAINELRTILSVTPNIVSGGDCKAAALQFATQVYEQLISLSASL